MGFCHAKPIFLPNGKAFGSPGRGRNPSPEGPHTPPITFRNVARYVQDVEANLPLYQALGTEVVRQMGRAWPS